MDTLANSEDLDEMLHIYAAFHLGLHCLPRLNLSPENEIQYILEIITGDPPIYTKDHPDFTVCSIMENCIHLKRVINPHTKSGHTKSLTVAFWDFMKT